MLKALTALALVLAITGAAQAQTSTHKEWQMETGYDLPRRASLLRPQVEAVPVVSTALPAAVKLFDATASHSQILSSEVPTGDFTTELWVMDHVNTPIGALLSVGDVRLGYYNRKAVYGAQTMASLDVEDKAFKERWHDLVLVRKGGTLTLYHNGVQIGQAPYTGQTGPIRLDSYLMSEPYMIPANLVHVASFDGRALTATEIATRYADRARLVEDGRIYADRFHFTQPPYLNVPQMDSIELSFEFDRPADAQISWGESEETMKTVAQPARGERLHGLKLDGLKADTPYVYRVTGTDASGRKLDSGLLSFRTAPPAGQPFVVIVSADTEARPHINDRMSQLMWEERPNLLAIMGDLTDGGDKDKRFEWTHEYFTGMGPFFGRVPTLGVVGNGESELKWYRHYHRHPGTENYFSMVYGDVEFFVLDSNLAEREKESPGFRARQAAWLDGALSASKARWKIAMHHHDVRTSDNDDYGDSFAGPKTEGDSEVQKDLLPLYDKHHVDLVVFGHLHSYERSWPLLGKAANPDGITYLQVGGLGGNLEDFAPNKPWFSARTVRAYHYVTLNVTPETIEGRMVDSEGRVRDVFTVRHPKAKR